MPLYVYEKQLNNSPPLPQTLPPNPPKKKLPLHPLPLITSFAGLILIASVVWPVLSYEISSSRYTPPTTASGLLIPAIEADPQVLSSLESAPKVVGNTDFTKASNWFIAPVNLPAASPSPQLLSYRLSIPKLKINQATVRTDNDDLSQSLVHYPGTAAPGDLGSAVIFGHSILPQFYNPKNYLSIFSLLPTLSEGDEILLEVANVTYTYRVSSKKEVYPTDLSPLEQRYEARQIKLITCVPPGLKTKRLVVTADLVKT